MHSVIMNETEEVPVLYKRYKSRSSHNPAAAITFLKESTVTGKTETDWTKAL
jgi:hypothetical protein